MRTVILSLSGTVTALLLCVLTLIPLPYAIDRAGPTFDLFGEEGGQTRLSLVGEVDTYPPSGELRLTTVAVQGGPGSGVKVGALIREWLSPAAYVFPDEYTYVPGAGSISRQWITSQEMAMVAALTHLGIVVPAVVTISEIDQESQAVGLLEAGDVVIAVNGNPVVTYEDLDSAFDPLVPGDDVTITVKREDQEVTVTFPTIDNGAGRAIMGVWVLPRFDFPFTVSIHIDQVGGSSAGMMFALGIIDLLTPEDELKGERVAGTGTIDIRGNVGPISGVDLKMHGAASDGARWFLAPELNCPWIVGRVPDGLTVVPVSTLDQAYDVVIAIGEGRTDALPSCE